MINSSKEIIENYWEAANNRDWVSFEALSSENIVYDLPQTRERIRGCENFKEFNATYPGNWALSIVRLVVDEYQAVSQITFLDNNDE
jgi:SnoaL-like domain